MSIKIISKNKKANFEYFIEETYESGIILKGTEIKSIRLGKVQLVDAFIKINSKNELFIMNMHISKFTFGNINNHDETRSRKLLLKKQEILKISQKIKEQNLTIIPIQIYIKDGYAKLEIALAKGKKLHDKRQVIKDRDNKREINKNLKYNNR